MRQLESDVQTSLSKVLQYFLYTSVNRASFLSVLVKRLVLNSSPLAKVVNAFQLVGVAGRHLPVKSRMPGVVTIRSFARTLARAYELWEKILSRCDAQPKLLPLGQSFNEWVRKGGHLGKYRAVRELQNLVTQDSEFFLRAVVHGSIATLDDKPGFSDMDLAFVTRASVLKDPKKLLSLRELAAEILTLTYAFDPFMHHGPYYLSEIDLAWYPEAMFPAVLFGYGVDLLDNSQELEICARPSDDVTDRQLDMFQKFFERWLSNPFVLKDSSDLEWVLASAMILPALYLQRRTRTFRYKRDTFPLAEKDFSPEEWHPIRTASELRANLGPLPKPSRPLVLLARQLGWPGLLQRWARRHPLSVQRAQEATSVLESDYPKRVLRLLRTMRSKLRD